MARSVGVKKLLDKVDEIRDKPLSEQERNRIIELRIDRLLKSPDVVQFKIGTELNDKRKSQDVPKIDPIATLVEIASIDPVHAMEICAKHNIVGKEFQEVFGSRDVRDILSKHHCPYCAAKIAANLGISLEVKEGNGHATAYQ